MNIDYGKDNKERIPYEHYLAEFRKLNPQEAAQRTGIPWHEETQEFEMHMMQKRFLIKWPECTIRKADPEGHGYGAMEDGIPPKIMVMRYLTRGVSSTGSGNFLTYREVPHGEVYFRQFQGRCMMRLAFGYGSNLSLFHVQMEKIGAKKLDMGDAAYEFEFLDKYFVRFILWAGDDEFPPSSRSEERRVGKEC